MPKATAVSHGMANLSHSRASIRGSSRTLAMSSLFIPSGAPSVWRFPPLQWVLAALGLAAAIATFYSGLSFMVVSWGQVEEYSYGYFIPAITAFLIWQRSDRLREMELQGSWSGLALVLLALVMGVVGEFSAVRLFSQYGFVVALFGLSLCCIGWRGTRVIAVPLAFLFFMIPLPQFLLRELSQSLQLLSSQIGVALIRAFDISVFLEGNVIDLGSFKLQVVDACSGLRYLFPLMVLGLLAAYFFQSPWWKRALIVVSTVPLTIVINSLRIGLIGVTVEYWGPAMAEGLLHDFEGWFMFMICLALLVGEMALLARFGSRGRPLREVFGLEYPDPAPKGASVQYRRFSAPLATGALLLAAAGATLLLSPVRDQVKPQRTPFAMFPMQFDGWTGRPDHIDRDILAWLAVDDHVIANYSRAGEPWVNFYSAYYASQSGGQSAHSPRTCMPGGGWAIAQLTVTDVPLPPAAGITSLAVNRAVIQKGEQRQLVYYWFNQRGRTLTDELTVKWFILKDGITRSRSDGALIRLVTPIARGEDIAQADRRLAGFTATLLPRLKQHIPD